MSADITTILTTSERDDVLAMRTELSQQAADAPGTIEDTAGERHALTQYDSPLTAAQAIAAIDARYPNA